MKLASPWFEWGIMCCTEKCIFKATGRNATLPFALLHKFGNGLLVPVVTMLVAHPVLGLDRIGVELQNPFSLRSLSHLPLGDISMMIEQDLLAMLQTPRDLSPTTVGALPPVGKGDEGAPPAITGPSRAWPAPT